MRLHVSCLLLCCSCHDFQRRKVEHSRPALPIIDGNRDGTLVICAEVAEKLLDLVI
jgi:hypothetical protein